MEATVISFWAFGAIRYTSTKAIMMAPLMHPRFKCLKPGNAPIFVYFFDLLEEGLSSQEDRQHRGKYVK